MTMDKRRMMQQGVEGLPDPAMLAALVQRREKEQGIAPAGSLAMQETQMMGVQAEGNVSSVPAPMGTDGQIGAISAPMGFQPGAGAENPAGYAPMLVDKLRVKEAMQTLMDYKKGKASVDERIVSAQQWWKLRNWEQIKAERGTEGTQDKKSNTAWLWNCIVGKHADYMDAFPEPLFLSRNQEDEPEAQHLSELVPVVLAQNGFEETYSQCGWQKNTEGTAMYGVFWDGTLMGGIGDVVVRKINVLNLITEPGIEDIQDSANVFLVKKVNNEELEQKYPQLIGKLGFSSTLVSEYMHDDAQDNSKKSLLVDWYYKKWVNGRAVLHYCQFVNEEVLYASENDAELAMRGYYDDGDYPFVPDVLFPVADSIYGMGYVDVAKDTQIDIDTMSQAMVTNAVVSSTPRYFISKAAGVNEKEFADLSKALIKTNSNLGADSLAPVQTPQMPGNALNMYQSKIEEMKFITGNTDVQNGAVPSGVTSGVAIAALKEDAGRSSKDSSRTSYRAMKRLYLMVVERIRQFYTLPRQFRIVGENGAAQYMMYSNQKLMLQTQRNENGEVTGYRLPQIDVDVHVQRENAYTRMSLNDLASQFYQMGIFLPQNSQQALMMLSMMEFKGKEIIVQKIQQSAMAWQMAQQLAMQQAAMASGGTLPAPGAATGPVSGTEDNATETGKRQESDDKAHTPATDRIRAQVNEAVRP